MMLMMMEVTGFIGSGQVAGRVLVGAEDPRFGRQM